MGVCSVLRQLLILFYNSGWSIFVASDITLTVCLRHNKSTAHRCRRYQKILLHISHFIHKAKNKKYKKKNGRKIVRRNRSLYDLLRLTTDFTARTFGPQVHNSVYSGNLFATESRLGQDLVGQCRPICWLISVSDGSPCPT